MRSYCSDSCERDHGARGHVVVVGTEEVESAGFADGLDSEDEGWEQSCKEEEDREKRTQG